ncbi:MAG TPA: sensor histidine kinase KdpD [Arachidicoccus sp.]|nr:sensor histidine kinase KdpD [Arachidicoccus sp.]
MTEDNINQGHFLGLIQRSRRGKFKIYIGMSAGVGKTYRMLQEAHSLFASGIDVKIGYIETHSRQQTVDLLKGLPVIPRRNLFYKGKQLEEFDLQAVINLRPEVVVIDELAHSNIEGSKNEKRWQDVLEVLDNGINVISAVNIQHIESLNVEIKRITGVEVTERVPDKILSLADEVVNIDLTADELITRLKEGKIYPKDKIDTALNHFFKGSNILQLRQLALKEVASQVVRQVETTIQRAVGLKREKFLACIGSNSIQAKTVIRKTARLAAYYSADWTLLYVQTPRESAARIALDKQRLLINNFKLATELGGLVVSVRGRNIPETIITQAKKLNVTTVCIGKPHISFIGVILSTSKFKALLKQLSKEDIDLIILS